MDRPYINKSTEWLETTYDNLTDQKAGGGFLSESGSGTVNTKMDVQSNINSELRMIRYELHKRNPQKWPWPHRTRRTSGAFTRRGVRD